MVGKCRLVKELELLDKIEFAHTSAVTAWTPIYSSVFGALIPMESADANVTAGYYRAGLFNFTITGGVTVAQGDKIYYITATGLVTNSAPSSITSAAFLLGRAFAAGTDTAGYVDVEITSETEDTDLRINQTATAAGETARIWNTNSATSGNIRGLSVRSFITGTGTQDGESLRAYTLISGVLTGSGVHGAHITAQIGDESAASTANCTGEVAGVRATIGIGLTNTAPVGGTIASLRLDSYFQSTAASAASSFIYACDVSTYGVDSIIRLGTLVNRTTSKSTMTAAYAYVVGKMTLGSASIALKVVTPDGAFYIPGLLASDFS